MIREPTRGRAAAEGAAGPLAKPTGAARGDEARGATAPVPEAGSRAPSKGGGAARRRAPATAGCREGGR